MTENGFLGLYLGVTMVFLGCMYRVRVNNCPYVCLFVWLVIYLDKFVD